MREHFISFLSDLEARSKPDVLAKKPKLTIIWLLLDKQGSIYRNLWYLKYLASQAIKNAFYFCLLFGQLLTTVNTATNRQPGVNPTKLWFLCFSDLQYSTIQYYYLIFALKLGHFKVQTILFYATNIQA